MDRLAEEEAPMEESGRGATEKEENPGSLISQELRDKKCPTHVAQQTTQTLCLQSAHTYYYNVSWFGELTELSWVVLAKVSHVTAVSLWVRLELS